MMDANTLYEESLRYFPKGINSPAQSFLTVGGNPFFCVSAKGACLQDAGNNRYADLNNSGGGILLGHAHPVIEEAVIAQLHKGFSAGTPTETETEFAKIITNHVLPGGQVCFFSSESEACANAVKLARAFTNRKKILKFSGGYHGDSGSLLKDSGAGDSLISGLNSAGIPDEISALTFVVPYNSTDEAAEFFRHHAEDCAAVIVEPVAANMGCVPAEFSFISGLREICDKAGSVLIFDESKTGLRLAPGGAEDIYKVKPDLRIFGSAVANGSPLGILIGSSDMMSRLMPSGNVFAEGNPSGNALAYAAGIATIDHILRNPDFYEQLNKKAETLNFEIGKILNEKGISHRINQKGSMMSLFFQIKSVSCFSDALDSNLSLFNNFFHHLLRNGVFLPPNGLRSWFLSEAFGDNETSKILEAVHKFRYD